MSESSCRYVIPFCVPDDQRNVRVRRNSGQLLQDGGHGLGRGQTALARTTELTERVGITSSNSNPALISSRPELFL